MKVHASLVIVAGIVIGVGATLTTSALLREPQPRSEIKQGSSREVADIARRLRSLEKTQSALLSQTRQQPVPDNTVEGAHDKEPTSNSEEFEPNEPMPPNGPNPEIAFLEKIKAHASEPVDPSWAPEAVRSLRVDLDKFLTPELQARALDLTCATTTCTASLEWPSWDVARAKYASLVNNGYSINCGREMILPEPSDKTASYRATLLFECEDARVNAAQ